VMLLGGLWHGASWNFVLWGGIHGAMLGVERARGKHSVYDRLPVPIRIGLTFVVVCISWVFFRANNIGETWRYLKSMIGLADVARGSEALATTIYTPYHLLMFLICAVVVWTAPQAWTFSQRLTPAKAGICFGLLSVSIVFLWTQTVNPFLYFQF